MAEDKHQKITRRGVLAGAGLTAAAALLPREGQAAAAKPRWDHEVDVVCVGSGAAAGTAAVTAKSLGASVLVLEKMPVTGGTTAKSGGVTWICNHFVFKEQGIRDERPDALQYLARYAHPDRYDPTSPTLGLDALDFKLLEAFYDQGSVAIDHLRAIDAVQFKQFRMFTVNEPAPDYADHLPENKTPAGRALEPAVGSGSAEGGGSLAGQLEAWLAARQVPVLTDTRVTRAIVEDGRVIGVEATSEGKTLRVRARKGVVFGTGGYSHNVELCELHQPGLYGACALPGSTGDFIAIAGAAGAKMGPMHTAWRSQVLLEEALEHRAVGWGTFVLPGDSMIVVNKYGKRVVNEKRDYNDRTHAHFPYDATREEHPNRLLFMLFDERSLDRFGGAFPFPGQRDGSRWMLSGATWDELFAKLDARLAQLAPRTGGVRLAQEFAASTKDVVARFNGYAKAGADPEFDRGLHTYDRQWHKLFSGVREGTAYGANPHPNLTMHPFADQGPYHAFILAPGALDTNAGPRINEHAQVLGHDGQPIPGLYGAGNCIASPSRQAYYGAGGTIGLAVTFGYIAGQHAAKAGA